MCTCTHAHTTHTSTHTLQTHTYTSHTHTHTHTHMHTRTHAHTTHTPQHLCSKCLSMWSLFIYFCLLLSLQDVSVAERDSQGVIAHLSKASDYAALIKADYPRLLGLLSQGAVSALWRRGRGGCGGEGDVGRREGVGG